MLVPELMDQVDAMPQMALFSEPPSAESFLNIIRTRIQERVAKWHYRHSKSVKIRKIEQLM